MDLSESEKKKIIRALKESPGDTLNFGRTALANERTLLAFIRTSISLLATGIGFIKLFEYQLLIVIGWIFIGVSIFIQTWGLFIYFTRRKLLLSELPDDLKQVKQ